MTTTNFNHARMEAEIKSLYCLDNERYCVCLRYGVFGVFPLAYATEKAYAIVCVTI